MPFPDELQPVVLVGSRGTWPEEFETLRQKLRALDLADEGAIEHIGSTSIPGLVAKDVIDVQVRLPKIVDANVLRVFVGAGFRHRPEEWNNIEATRSGPVRKLAFAPPIGGRAVNVHVRVDGSTGATDALLFRDYLRAHPTARDAWGDFKRTVVAVVPHCDLGSYGQIKQPAWTILMLAADAWTSTQRWRPGPLAPWSDL